MKHILWASALVLSGFLGLGFQAQAQSSSSASTSPVSTPSDGKTEVLWLGQAAMRITTPGGKVIMIDPWLIPNPKTPAEYKKLENLGHVDLILVTHAHADHFADAPALAQLNQAPVYAPAGLQESMQNLGILPTELTPRMNKSGTVRPFGPNGVKITAVHAEHSSELNWLNPTTGKKEMHVGGEPIGFLIELENGFKIWHMGDTGVFGDMKLIAEMYRPDLVMLPIGGNYTMGPKEAAFAMRELIKAPLALPMHYGTYPLINGSPLDFQAALNAGGNRTTEMVVMQPGDKKRF